MSIMGTIRSIFKLNKKRSKIAREEAIVVQEKSSARRLECYNRLKDNVLFANDNGKNKVIQVESSVAGECKTTVAANLAVSLGFTNKKVLVIDLDFRKPRMHQLFGLSIDNGIAEYMTGEIDKQTLIKKTKYKNVDLITRGEKIYNSSLVLTANKFKELVAEVREEYDFVIIDAAPVLQISDFIHISKVADGCLFLVAYGVTKRGQVREAIKELRKNGVNIIGTLFTMFDANEGYGNYYSSYKKYYNYGYGYGYGDGYMDEVDEVNDVKIIDDSEAEVKK